MAVMPVRRLLRHHGAATSLGRRVWSPLRLVAQGVEGARPAVGVSVDVVRIQERLRAVVGQANEFARPPVERRKSRPFLVRVIYDVPFSLAPLFPCFRFRWAAMSSSTAVRSQAEKPSETLRGSFSASVNMKTGGSLGSSRQSKNRNV